MNEMFVQQIRRLSRPFPVIKPELPVKLSRMRGIRAVIFDVYGTCFLSGSGDIGTAMAGARAEALSVSLREQGVEMDPALAPEAMSRFFELIGHAHREGKARGIAYPEVRILDIWEQWRREAGVAVDVPRLAIDVECRLNPVWPMPGLIHTLEQLQAAGLQLGIVSNAQVFTPCLFPALTQHHLPDLGIPAAHCIWSWRLQEAKPSVRLFEMLLRQLPGLEPASCLYVGNDMRNDIAPAAAVGMRTALFAGDARSLRLREGDALVGNCQPDVIVSSLPMILDCLVT